MAQSAASSLDGSTMSINPTNSASAIVELTSISISSERASIDVTSLTSTSRESIAGIPDAGTVDVDFNFIGAAASQLLLTTDLFTAASSLNAAGGFAEFVITWNSQASFNTTWTFDGFLTNVTVGGSEGEKIGGSATIKISDATDPPITIANA